MFCFLSSLKALFKLFSFLSSFKYLILSNTILQKCSHLCLFSGNIFNFSAPAYVLLEKPFSYENVQFFKLFQPIIFQLFSFFEYSTFCLLSFFKYSASCSAIKMFSFFSPFGLLLFSLSAFSAFEKLNFYCKILTVHSYSFMHFRQVFFNTFF